MLYFPLGFLALLCLITLFFQLKTGVPSFPSTKNEIKHVITLLKSSKLSNNSLIFELGSGWGGLSLSLAKQFPNHSIIGYELSPLPYFISKIRSFKYKNLHIKRKNFFKQDLSHADAICSYLMRNPMIPLKTKLDKEIDSGTPVITIAFYFPKIKPSKVIPRKGLLHADVALYYWKKIN
jgi:hypothetical protein